MSEIADCQETEYSPLVMSSSPLDSLALARFSEVQGTGFRVRVGSAEELLQLAQVTPGPSTPAGAKGPHYENFSLIFHGTGSRLIPQGTYAFSHEQLGAFDLFIVPVGREGEVILYQAVFNRLLGTG
jgi:hypothetical protein